MSGYDETTLLVRAIERMTPDELARFEADRDGYDTRDARYRHLASRLSLSLSLEKGKQGHRFGVPLRSATEAAEGVWSRLSDSN